MKETRRVVITQVNTKGRSCLLAEKHVERSGVGVFNFWQTFPDRPPDGALGLDSEFKFFPEEPGGRNSSSFSSRQRILPPSRSAPRSQRTISSNTSAGNRRAATPRDIR